MSENRRNFKFGGDVTWTRVGQQTARSLGTKM